MKKSGAAAQNWTVDLALTKGALYPWATAACYEDVPTYAMAFGMVQVLRLVLDPRSNTRHFRFVVGIWLFTHYDW